MSRMFQSACAALAGAALAATAAGAADLPSRYAPPAPYYERAPTFTWTGLYAGINGQLGVGSWTGYGPQLFGTPFGGFGGGTLGYNYQSGRLLVGAEADVGFGSVSGRGNFGTGTYSSGEINGIGTIRGRVGYVMDRTLLYVTGGYAGTQLNAKIGDYAGQPNLLLNQSRYLNGFAIGAGVEYALTTKISVKGEYLFTGFGQQAFFPGTRDAGSAGANISLIRAGLNYHF